MTAEFVESGNTLHTTTPDAWEAAMRPAVGDVCIKEVFGSRFAAEMNLFVLPRTAFFSLKMSSARVAAPGGNGFVSVNLVSQGQLRTDAPKRGSEWVPGDAHVVDVDAHPFGFKSDEHLDVLTLCFHKPLLDAYSRKFYGSDSSTSGHIDADLVLNSEIGFSFIRYFSFVWEELNRGGAFLQSSIATEEIEDGLWSLFLSAIEAEMPRRTRGPGHTGHIDRAEEYIMGHLGDAIRVPDIAAAAGVSVSTLNRAFRAHHGSGPKAFVKRRRLDRARTDLQHADPETTTVTEIATKYGFWHLSQFAGDYQRAFQETPSQTLRRR